MYGIKCESLEERVEIISFFEENGFAVYPEHSAKIQQETREKVLNGFYSIGAYPYIGIEIKGKLSIFSDPKWKQIRRLINRDKSMIEFMEIIKQFQSVRGFKLDIKLKGIKIG